MIKNVLLCTTFLTVLFVGINLQHVDNEYSPAVMANVDALSTPEGEDGGVETFYNRHEGFCDFYVKANATVTILGLGVFQADANGLVRVSGQLACSSGGVFTCRPIECYDIYQLLSVSERD